MSFRGAEEGVSLLEFALIVPILVFIVLGVADFSLVIAQSVIVTQAAERREQRLGRWPGITATTPG